MNPFRILKARAVPLHEKNIDTDQLLPARFLKRSRSGGYGDFLFHDRRFDSDGQVRSDFALNAARFKDARIVIANTNFGCGSSREGAVYALYDFGIRCVVAPSFGNIFFNNALQNGLLPVRLDETVVAELRAQAEQPDANEITVDLERQLLISTIGRFTFEVPPFSRECLLRGLDGLQITLEARDEIRSFEARYFADYPWIVPA